MSTTTVWSRFPGLPFALPFEASFDQIGQRTWFAQNWTISISLSIVYIIAVQIGQRFMRNRKPFNLRTPLATWSFVLAVFSLIGTLRILPELISTVKDRGLEASICDNRWQEDLRVEFWIWAFVWSKAFELVDTAFIVLRKQKLIFLHWYHHFITLTYAFYGFTKTPSVYRWFAGMNFVVHTVMYGYYAARAMRIKVPSIVAVTITSAQIAQMIIGTAINVWGLIIKSQGGTCAMSNWDLYIGLIVYTSFLVLFANFFIKTYLVGGGKNESAKSKSS